MFEFKLQFSGEIPAIHNDKAEHGDVLERIGREVVELLRQQGYMVRDASLGGPRSLDLTSGTKPAVVTTAFTDDVTKNERGKKTPPAGKASA